MCEIMNISKFKEYKVYRKEIYYYYYLVIHKSDLTRKFI